MATEAEQVASLDDALENVRKQSFYMKRALDNGNVRETLKYASSMAGELRTNALSPQNYFELFLLVTAELRELQANFEDLASKKIISIMELYDNVQYAGNIVPRLYLLITVGGCFIRSKTAEAKDILYDLVELCRGVQHPMRGLFLRDYLSQMSKDKLPGTNGCVYEGDVKDSIHFILTNFGEMNKLWVRMQHQGAVRDRTRREQERKSLRQLVGTNLFRLSEIDAINVEEYTEKVLPRILEQIVNCKDVIAQEYLMDCVIQVFPAEFHLGTLETFLSTCSQLQDKVKVQKIIKALMDRLSSFALDNREKIPDDLKMFPIFHKYTQKVIESNSTLTLNDILSLQVALVNFTSKCYPEKLKYIDHILQYSSETIGKSGSATVDDFESVQHIVDLLSLPLETLSLRILELKNFAPLMSYLALQPKKRVALAIVAAVVKTQTVLDDVKNADTLFKYLSPLIHDQVSADGKSSSRDTIPDEERFEFDQEQTQVAQLFQLIGSEDTNTHFKLYQTARTYFGAGGVARIEYTLPPLIFGSIELAKRMFEAGGAASDAEKKASDKKAKQVFGFIHETLSGMVAHYPELTLRLFVQAAQAAAVCNFEAIAYEFVAQAFLAYEDSIADSKAQAAAISYITTGLHEIDTFSVENFDILSSRATQHASKLLKKTDQCRAVYNCAHLFWQVKAPVKEEDAKGDAEGDEEEQPQTRAKQGTPYRDPKRVLACLQRSIKIANACMGSQVHLFVEILNKYLYFFEQECPSIGAKYIKGLIDLIDEHSPSLDSSPQSTQAKQYYQNTLAHIAYKQRIEGEIGDRYTQIQLPN